MAIEAPVLFRIAIVKIQNAVAAAIQHFRAKRPGPVDQYHFGLQRAQRGDRRGVVQGLVAFRGRNIVESGRRPIVPMRALPLVARRVQRMVGRDWRWRIADLDHDFRDGEALLQPFDEVAAPYRARGEDG